MKRAAAKRADGGTNEPGNVGGEVARIVALLDSLAVLDCDIPEEADMAEEVLTELEGRIRELGGRLEKRRGEKDFRGWMAEESEALDLLDDLDGPPVALLFDLEAIYGLRLASAFARLGAGEDAAAVLADAGPERWGRMVARAERFARWTDPAALPDPIAGFGIMVGMLGWLCGRPAGGWAASPFLGWVLDAVEGWTGGKRLALAATAAGMDGEARRKLAIGLAAYCTRLEAEARVGIRMILQEEEAEAEVEDARAEMYLARGESADAAAARDKAENARRKLAAQMERLRAKEGKAKRMAAAAEMGVDLFAVARLHGLEGKTIPETARELGLSERTVARRWADYREKTDGRRLPAGRPGLKIANMGTEQAEREAAQGGRTPHRGSKDGARG